MAPGLRTLPALVSNPARGPVLKGVHAMISPSSYIKRFEAWQGEHPGLTFRDHVVTFLGALRPSLQRPMLSVLRAHYGADACAWTGIPLARYQRDEARLRASVLTPEELTRLWTRARLSPRDRALCTAFFTLRRFEVVSLKWADLDLAAGLVYVTRGKGGRAAWTALPPVAVSAFQGWQAASPPVSLASLVFPADVDGRAYHPDALGRVARMILRGAGLWRVGRGPHAFRRTFATTFLRERPGELRRLQVLMRHRQLATTVLYDYPEPADYRDAVAGLTLGGPPAA